MKLLKNSIILITLPFIFLACQAKQPIPEAEVQTSEAPQIKQIFDNISVEDFKPLINDTNIVILDVRTDEEVAQGNVEGSIQIDFFSEDFKDQLAELDPEKEYVVYCRSGGRSSQAAKILTEELGFKKVRNLEGGYNAFSQEN